MKEVVRNGHADSKNETVGVALEHGFHVSLCFRVEGSVKVGFVFFGKSNARSERVSVVVLEDAAGSIDGAVNAFEATQVGDIKSSNDVRTNRLGFVVLAPVNVGPSSNASRHEDVRRLDLFEFSINVSAILNTRFRIVNFDAWRIQETLREYVPPRFPWETGTIERPTIISRRTKIAYMEICRTFLLAQLIHHSANPSSFASKDEDPGHLLCHCHVSYLRSI